MEAIAKSLIIHISTITTSLTYSYFISSNLPKGIYRFISLIPILFIFTILPLHCSSVFTTAIIFSLTTWLTNFKLIRFAFDLDQSPYHPSYSLLHFITLTSLPVQVQPAKPVQPPKPARIKLGFQILIFAILVQISVSVQNLKILVLFIYCGLLFLIIDIITAIINNLLQTLTGLELEPSSNHPYFATSLQNFWTRWNLMVTTTLRHTVYKPVLSVFNSRFKWAPLAGILASFIVSGLMHELFVYHLSREKPTWEMTSFFVLHGVCVCVEMIVKRAVDGGKWRLPEFVATVLTVGFVVVTGFWLFFPPLIRNGLDVKIFQEYMSVADFIKNEIFYRVLLIHPS